MVKMVYPFRQSSPQMTFKCSHLLWKINFFSVTYSVTEQFEFLNCDWRWEYFVHTIDDEGIPVDTVTLYLRRLSDATECPVKKISTIVSVKNSEGESFSTSFTKSDVSPLVSWRVWSKKKYSMVTQDLVQNDFCTFSLTIDPLGNLEELVPTKISENLYSHLCSREMSKDFSELLESADHTDVRVICGDHEAFAHKAVLCSRSKTFANIIGKASTFEKDSADSLRVKLPYMEPIVFQILLQFIYTAELPDLSMELAKEVYQAANEYCVESLKKTCARFFMVNVSSSDAIDILLLADRYKDDYLRWAVSSRIAWDGSILSSDAWMDFSKHNQKLTIDVFKIFTERVYKRVNQMPPI